MLYFQWQKNWAVREGDWKLIKKGNRTTLHNLADKNPEEKDYLQERPDVATKLQDKYRAWALDVFSGSVPK